MFKSHQEARKLQCLVRCWQNMRHLGRHMVHIQFRDVQIVHGEEDETGIYCIFESPVMEDIDATKVFDKDKISGRPTQ
jgi:hypothetical protein